MLSYHKLIQPVPKVPEKKNDKQQEISPKKEWEWMRASPVPPLSSKRNPRL